MFITAWETPRGEDVDDIGLCLCVLGKWVFWCEAGRAIEGRGFLLRLHEGGWDTMGVCLKALI